MLHISVSIHRQFEIANSLIVVEEHFRNFEHMLEDLPALKVNAIWGPHQYRIGYSANFAGNYDVNLLCDVNTSFDTAAHELVISPLRGHPKIAVQATRSSLTGQGEYASRLKLHAQKECTIADYGLTITATIPKPPRLILVPNLVARIAVQTVVRNQVQEITETFILRTKRRLFRQP